MMRIKAINQTLNFLFSSKAINQKIEFLFSNQPKNIPKPSSIEFDFKIPKKTSSKVSAPQREVKMTKAKRQTDVSKLLKKKQQRQEYKFKVQESYQQQQNKKVIQNLKTIRYHEDEYMKGEHLIENIPLDPFYSYKLADFEKKVEAKKQNIKNLIASQTNFDLRAQNKFNLAEEYHEKQQKYEIEEFLRYLDNYPGSPKGPKPQDDMDFYIEYAYKKIPSVLMTRLAGDKAEKDNKIKKRDTNDLENDKYRLPKEDNYSSMLSTNRPLEPPLQKDDTKEHQIKRLSNHPIYKEYQEIPEIPELQFVNYQQYMKEYMNWRNFKNYHIDKCGSQIVNTQLQYVYKVECAKDPQPENEYFTPRGHASSLLRYYKTLPKQIQDNPGIKDVVLGLEFLCPHIPYEEKEQAINMACTMALPLDKVSTRAMNDFIAKKKEYITPFMVDKIFSINPEYTWDIFDFFGQIKREQLKGQSMVKENETSYPEPPQVHLEWQEGAPNLPIDFYDNDDGFWDEIISEKLKRQDEAKPIMKVRKHFLH